MSEALRSVSDLRYEDFLTFQAKMRDAKLQYFKRKRLALAIVCSLEIDRKIEYVGIY